MAKIRYTVRLYRPHDLDLITFIMTHEFDVMHGIYSALTAFANGEGFVIDIPPERDIPMPQLRRVYTKALVLDTERDRKAIALLERIKNGYRNNFLKGLLRQYLCYPMSEEFLENRADAEMFREMFHVFRDGKRHVKAGKTKKQRMSGKSRSIPAELTSEAKAKGKPELNSASESREQLELNSAKNALEKQKLNSRSDVIEKQETGKIEPELNSTFNSDDDDLFNMFSGLL